MLNFLWWILGYSVKEKCVLCVNSFAKTDRKINYVVQRFPTDSEDDELSDNDIDSYFKKYY